MAFPRILLHTKIHAFILSIVFSISGTLVSLHRYWQYEVSFIDFGHFDSALWKVSRFQEPITNHFIHGRINVLGDHVTPSVFLISPLYWLTDRSEMILIVQAIAIGISGFVLYLLAYYMLRRGSLSIAVMMSYFLFVGLQNAVITEFHELTVMILPLMLTIWAFVTNRKKLYFFFLLLTLGFKEITFALGIGIGIAIFLLQKDWRKPALVTILLSILWGFVAFKVIIPYFSNGQYLYASSLPDGIIESIYAFVDHPLKQRTLFYSFFSFSFLPLFSFQFWPLFVQDYAARFLPQNFVTRWDLGMHYNAQSAVLLAVSSVYVLRVVISRLKNERYIVLIAILMMLNAVFLFRFILHGPFLLAINPAFYAHTANFAFLDTMVSKVPKGASVMTQNNIATRFTHQTIWLLGEDYEQKQPEYILLDARKEQSPNNYFGSATPERMLVLLKGDTKYTVIYKTQEQYVFKRKAR